MTRRRTQGFDHAHLPLNCVGVARRYPGIACALHRASDVSRVRDSGVVGPPPHSTPERRWSELVDAVDELEGEGATRSDRRLVPREGVRDDAAVVVTWRCGSAEAGGVTAALRRGKEGGRSDPAARGRAKAWAHEDVAGRRRQL